jgi:hypothetical protein
MPLQRGSAQRSCRGPLVPAIPTRAAPQWAWSATHYRGATPTGCMRVQASRAMKMRMATAAEQRTMAGSSPASVWPGSRYTPASASSVVVSPGRGKRQSGIQGRVYGAVRPDRRPVQPEAGTVRCFGNRFGPHPGQPGHPCRRPYRLHQAGDPRAVGVLGGAQQHPILGKVLQPIPGRINADIHRDLVGGKNISAHAVSPLNWRPLAQGQRSCQAGRMSANHTTTCGAVTQVLWP